MKKILIPIWEEKGQYHLNTAYVNYVHRAGYQAIMVGYDADATEMAHLADGLLLSGGGDIDPIYYGNENIASYWPDIFRDAIERELYWAFVAAEKPIFGICRGFQLIFLEEELRARKTNTPVTALNYKQHFAGHSQSDRAARWLQTHAVFYAPGLYNLSNKETKMDQRIYVNSMHHQGVKWNTYMQGRNRFLGEVEGPIAPLGYAPAGAKEPLILEAFTVHGKNVLAVQWHPEELRDYALLWNIFGEPTGAKRAMRDYNKTMIQFAEEAKVGKGETK
jgi:putative glutamine amidotransferase